MTTSDDRPAAAAPPASPPSFVRRHPIVAGFGVLSGLSLFSALWPVSAIVIMAGIAAHATGLDRVAWSLTRSLATHVVGGLRDHASGTPVPGPPEAPAPTPPSAPPPPRRDVRPPAPAARPPRTPRSHAPRPPIRARGQRTPDHPVETRVDGPGM